MNTIVNKLLDVDREARQMLDEAQQYYDHTIGEIEKQKEQLRAEFVEKAKRHIESLEAEQAGEIQEAAAAVRARTATLRGAMESHYEAHHREWEDELYRRVLGEVPSPGEVSSPG